MQRAEARPCGHRISQVKIKPQMQITWYGQACFRIQSGDVTIILNPFDKSVGLNAPRGKADIVLLSNGSSDAAERYPDAGFVIAGAGEYEIKEILIKGLSFFYADESSLKKQQKKATVYTLNIEGVTICSLDNAGKQEIESILDKIGEVDILMAPVGGFYEINGEKFPALDAEAAMKVINEIEPRIVIPMCYKIPKLDVKVEGVEKFLKAIGAHDVAPVDKLTIKKKDMPQEETKVILMETVN